MSEKVRIRKAELSDLSILVAHRRAMFESMGSFAKNDLDEHDRNYGEWLRKRLVAGEATAFVAKTPSQKIIASGAVFLRELDPAPGVRDCRLPHIISMFTEERYRGKGIASKIIEKLEAWCRSGGYPVVTLSPTKKEPELYIRAGFERSWMMKKSLSMPPHNPGRRREGHHRSAPVPGHR